MHVLALRSISIPVTLYFTVRLTDGLPTYIAEFSPQFEEKTIFDEHSVAVPELIRVVYEEVHEVALEAVVRVLGQAH